MIQIFNAFTSILFILFIVMQVIMIWEGTLNEDDVNHGEYTVIRQVIVLVCGMALIGILMVRTWGGF